MLHIDITKRLGELELVVNAQLPLQGITAIFGRSGAGKTSLVNILGGLSTPDSGQLTLQKRAQDDVLFNSDAGINLAPEKRNIGYVFQEARLFPHYSVRGNLNYGNKDKDDGHFNKIVQLLGLEALLSRYPRSLSGGEKQRVAIGRALLTRPQILLMDEPLAALDLPRKRELIPYLLELSQSLSIPIIYVSHSLDEILQLADHILVLEQGKVLVNGPVQTVWDSAEMRPWLPAKEQSALLTAKITAYHEKYAMTKLQLDDTCYLWINGKPSALGKALRVRIYANHVSISCERPANSSIRNILPTQVMEIVAAENSDNMQIKLALGKAHIWANITHWAFDDLALTVGQQVYAQIKGVNMTESELAQSF